MDKSNGSMNTYCHQCIHYILVDDDVVEIVACCEKAQKGFPNVVNCKEFKFETPLGSMLDFDE